MALQAGLPALDFGGIHGKEKQRTSPPFMLPWAANTGLRRHDGYRPNP
jgi:hypothetical protein